MKALLIFTLVLVVSILVIAMLPLAPIAHQILISMLAGNALMGLFFLLLMSGEYQD